MFRKLQKVTIRCIAQFTFRTTDFRCTGVFFEQFGLRAKVECLYKSDFKLAGSKFVNVQRFNAFVLV